ncbi:MAG: hypothetical protein IAE66_04025 [Xanthomonadaceae bacterium]|nr:hypothetical protein [Xanthomonadaceae bacterium]
MPATPPSAPDPSALHRLQASLARPAAVFAELCTGDAVAGDRAVAEALRTRPMDPGASTRALSIRFWRSLLASPDIRIGPLPALPSPLSQLGRLPPGLRVLALLKALSGLGEVELAALLGRTPAACRHALARIQALSGVTDDAWSAALASRAAAVSPARMGNIANGRSMPAALRQPGPAPARTGQRYALAAVVVVTALALAATYAWPGFGSRDGAPRIRTRALAEAAPKSRFDAATAIATHPDRALLEIDDADVAIARETAFYAWYQAERLGITHYEPPPPTFEAPEGVSSSTDTGSADAP